MIYLRLELNPKQFCAMAPVLPIQSVSKAQIIWYGPVQFAQIAGRDGPVAIENAGQHGDFGDSTAEGFADRRRSAPFPYAGAFALCQRLAQVDDEQVN
jgi:hypothetical protein